MGIFGSGRKPEGKTHLVRVTFANGKWVEYPMRDSELEEYRRRVGREVNSVEVKK